MKPNLLVVLFLSVCGIINYGCSKTGAADDNPGPVSTDPAVLIQNKWQIVRDVINVNNFAFPDGTIPNGGTYYGTPNDYYDFRADGKVYIYEGGPVGSSPYQLVSPTILYMSSFQWGNVTILALTGNSFVWEKSMTSSNGGTYYRRVDFKR
ncbi:MAG TPA: hypothetical protein VK484_04970 [Ferruginibacter sp.]|nr:hypothetical protein [Ferruginibacter sp.]